MAKLLTDVAAKKSTQPTGQPLSQQSVQSTDQPLFQESVQPTDQPSP